ncbi:hypothetical protein [Seinonella peptonophila]|uniref:hypothetical protein n=1 Tax=Seinonella peptonophila TaxID=112248 RepID=UPI001114AE01|nr:hypothetical protein [Seinonella peptonophila]
MITGLGLGLIFGTGTLLWIKLFWIKLVVGDDTELSFKGEVALFIGCVAAGGFGGTLIGVLSIADPQLMLDREDFYASIIVVAIIFSSLTYMVGSKKIR